MAEKSLQQAVSTGDELQILYATRRKVAEELETCKSGRDVASLANRLMELSERITQLEKAKPKKRKTALSSARSVRK